MKITMVTQELKNAIERMFKTLSKKQRFPYSESLYLEVDSENKLLKIITMRCNQNIIVNAAMTKVEIIEASEIVDARIILNDMGTFVNGFKFFKNGLVTFEFGNTATLVVQCGNKMNKVALLACDELPEFPQISANHTIAYSVNELKQRFNKIKYAIPNDYDVRCQGVHFNGADMVSCDGYKMAVNTDSKMTLDPITLSENAINMVFEVFKKGYITISQSKEYLVFASDETTFIARGVEREYIDYKKILLSKESKHVHEIEINKAEFAEGLGYIKAIIGNGNGEQPSVTMHNQTITANNQEKVAQVELSCTEVPFAISYDPRYMLDALKQFDEEYIALNIAGPFSPIIIKNETNTALVMPLRLSGRKKGEKS